MAKKFLVSIDLAGNELLNPVIHNLASDPVSPTPAAGRLYYHTGNNRLMVHQGGSFKQVAFTDELTGTQSLDTLTGWTTANDLTIGDTLTFNHNAANVTLVGASGSTGTASIFNTLSTTGNLFGAATTIAIGATSGTITLSNPTVVGTQTTVNLWNTTSTTVNAFGAATAVGVGATSGTLTLNNPTIVGSATLTLFNTVSTSVTAFSAATTLNLGVGPVSGGTINIGTQAASSGTKAINIGTAGTTGSTTTIVIGTTAGTTPTTTINGSITLGSYASAGFVKTNGSGVVSIDTSTYALTNQTMNIGTTSVAINRASSALSLTGIPSIDGVAADTATLWSSITTGSITIGAGLTTGALNLAAAGTGATVVTIGHTNATTTVNGTFKVGTTTLAAGGAVTATLPTLAGTLVGSGDTGTVTNTMLAGSIADSKLSQISTASKVSTAALTGNLFTLGSTAIAALGTTTTIAGLTLTSPVIDAITASAVGATPTLWSNITTGTISEAGALTTGTVNIASGTAVTTGILNLMAGAVSAANTRVVNIGTGSTASALTNINIGSLGTTTVNGTFKVGATTLAAGGAVTATLPSSTGTLALTSQIPTVNAGTLGSAASTTGSTNTTVETTFSAAWNANSASNVTIKNTVGPAIVNLVAAMTGGTAGIVRKTAQDTYSIDTGTYALQSYVDNAVAGLSWKDEVRVASTANLVVASGVVNGAVVDGITLATNDRILLKDQSAPAENGIYIVAASGAASRATDADSETDIRGASVFVTSGTTNGGKRFTCSVSGTITLGTTALPFVLFGADTTGNLVNKYAVSFGDGAATSYAITHNLGTLDVTVEVYTVSGGAKVECDVTHTSTTQVTLAFAVAPTSNQYRVVVHG